MNLKIAVNESDQQQGDKHAPLVLVEYGDYECPHCGAAYPIVKQLQKHFGKQLLLVFRNFPLAEIHPHALGAAYIAESSGLQSKFWEMHDLIFEHQDKLSVQHLLNYATSAGIDLQQLMTDMKSAGITEKVENDMLGGARSGVNGTPTFFINGNRHDGYYDFESLKEAIEKELGV